MGNCNKDDILQLDKLRSNIVEYGSMNPDSQTVVSFALRTVEEVQKAYNTSNGLKKTKDSDVAPKESCSLDFDPTTKPIMISREQSHETIPSRKNQKSSSRIRHQCMTLIFTTLRIFILELPLIMIFALAVITSTASYWYGTYLEPQIDQMTYTDSNRTQDLTYYHRNCLPYSLTAHEPSELMIKESFTTDDCVEHMMTHGMSMYKSILDDETSDILRSWILERNKSLKKSDEINVISNENRWSFYIGVNDHPSITKALNQIVKHEQFRPALEKIVGPNPAIIEMTAITSSYGAEDQFWHPDIVSTGSPTKYARSFVPSYSLFITLQDTSSEMGATDVCPGTYMCSNNDAADTCEHVGFQVSGDDKWKKGDAIFMNQQSFHRGAAHNDPTGPHRVLFIISFSHKPFDQGETRMLGQGGSYSLKWNMWGHTLADLEHPERMRLPWTALRGLGMYKRKGEYWGWDWISNHMMRLANADTGYDHETFIAWEKEGAWGLPNLLRLKMTPNMTLREYYRGSVALWATVAKKITIISYSLILLFITIKILISMILHRKQSLKILVRPHINMALRLAMIDFIMMMMSLTVIHYGSNTNWAKAIKSNTLYPPPFTPVYDTSLIPKRSLVAVTENDVLVTDRFDQHWLASLANIPDYQTGNQNYSALIHGSAPLYDILNDEGKDMLASSLVRYLHQQGSHQVLHDELGNWVLLSELESISHVKQSLQLELSSKIIGRVRREVLFLISDYKHGWRNTGVMARKFSVMYLNRLLENILENASIPVFSPYVTPDIVKTVHSGRFTTNTKGRFYLPQGNTLHTIRTISPSSLRTTNTPKPNEDETSFAPNALKVGDIVESKYNGFFNEVRTKCCVFFFTIIFFLTTSNFVHLVL